MTAWRVGALAVAAGYKRLRLRVLRLRVLVRVRYRAASNGFNDYNEANRCEPQDFRCNRLKMAQFAACRLIIDVCGLVARQPVIVGCLLNYRQRPIAGCCNPAQLVLFEELRHTQHSGESKRKNFSFLFLRTVR